MLRRRLNIHILYSLSLLLNELQLRKLMVELKGLYLDKGIGLVGGGVDAGVLILFNSVGQS